MESFTNYEDIENYLEKVNVFPIHYAYLAETMYFSKKGQVRITDELGFAWWWSDNRLVVDMEIYPKF